MSDMCIPSTIESFPTELWCEIFKFFDAFELYRTFNNQNSRITSIFSESTPLYFEIATIRDYNLASGTILPILNNRANVRSFKFYQEFQIEEFFTLWPINTFSQLRHLSLVYVDAMMNDCSIVMIDHLSTLANFEYLHIQVESIVHRDQYMNRLLQLIFVENDTFHSLKRFIFQCNTNSNSISIPLTTKQTNLQFLTLPPMDRDDFVQLLTCIPHIKSLKTNWLYTPYDSIPVAMMSSLSSVLPNCLDLNLLLDQNWTFEYVEFLLQQVPNVNQLKLMCHYLLMNANKWEQLLTKNCSKLQMFELVSSDSYYNTPPIFNELQSSFSTEFWLQKNIQLEYSEKVHRLIVRFEI